MLNKKLHIKCPEEEEEEEEGNLHPHCPHGPTLFFYHIDARSKEMCGGYYACSAYRDRHQCGFHVNSGELTKKILTRRYDLPITEYKTMRAKFLDAALEAKKHYCLSCNVPLIENDLQDHITHELVRNLSPTMLEDPTQFLHPLNNDKAQAQYFFDAKALKFFGKCFQDLGVSKVVCMGAPRLHSYLLKHWAPSIQSFLLDFDQRFFYFFDDNQYGWFNMCNNHFFDAKQKEEFEKFLKCTDSEVVLIFTDPPFGCRTEPIVNTLKQMTKLHNKVNNLPHQPLPIFWIFPYYSAHYIQQQLPALQMCDYKVNYTNHEAYTDVGGKCRKLGSPVRIFTNVPLERLLLPVEEEYKYCASCQRYTALENRHCPKCLTCPSKNGSTYRHCEQCGVCVKPSYVHCVSCRRCTQVEGHNCSEYQTKQRCWICRQVGHTERQCAVWRKYCKHSLPKRKLNNKQHGITCYLCGKVGHNESTCRQRSLYIEEITFLGKTQLKFKA